MIHSPCETIVNNLRITVRVCEKSGGLGDLFLSFSAHAQLIHRTQTLWNIGQ